MRESFNPYAAPQTPLQELPPTITLPPAKQRNHLLQGIVAGLQLGVIAALMIITLGVVIWGKEYSMLGMLWLLVGIVLISTVIGTVIGGIVQLLSMLFGGPPRLDEEHSTPQEIDNTGFTPPNIN